MILDKLDLVAYPKTSGATGIHIYVPLEPVYDYARVRRFVEETGKLIVAADPETVTMTWGIVKRGPRVFIDHNQNVAGKTIASVYSVRPLPGAPVSTPLLWDEIDDVEPRRILRRITGCKLDGIHVISGLLSEVALKESHATAVANIDCGYQ